ncbi:MAG: aldolase/citrate lyase family protein, partial [Roseovarius gahaiensis]
MDTATRPFRSVLYIPGSKDRALDKARTLPCDAIIFDLEDAVSPEAKPQARETLANALKQGGYGKRSKIVRINALTTEWGLEDARALRDAGADAILLPKVNTPSDVDNLADMLGPDMPIWVMMERSLVLIKPDATRRKLIGKILSRFEENNLTIKALKMLKISKELAEK